MSEKLHHNGSIRLKHYDYGRNGFYFVTICAKNRENYFCEINKGKIKYTELGKTAIKCWSEIPKHFPFVVSDEFVIMPDHVHGIIFINKTDGVGARNDGFVGVRNDGFVGVRNDGFVGACHGMRLQGNVFSKPKHGSLWTIINHFKGSVTRYANQNKISFAWQPRYYEHIVRNEYELNRIRRYIRNNPIVWHR